MRNCPGAVPMPPPRLDEVALAVELDDAGDGVPARPGALAAVALGDEDVAVRGDVHVVGLVEERPGAVAGHAGPAQGHQELAVGVELEDGVPLALVGGTAPAGGPGRR